MHRRTPRTLKCDGCSDSDGDDTTSMPSDCAGCSGRMGRRRTIQIVGRNGPSTDSTVLSWNADKFVYTSDAGFSNWTNGTVV
jgi:hypothetical protein